MNGEYFPRRGNEGYRVEHYDLAFDYRVASNQLKGVATLTVSVTVAGLTTVVLDFASLRVDRVLVGGARVKYEHKNEKLRVRLPSAVATGDRLTVEVAYRGSPIPTNSRYGGLGWEQLDDGVLVASQPTGAPSWFPCDDRPDRKATFRFTVSTSSAYHVVATGRPTDVGHSGSETTWTYEQDAPTATYLASLQIGPYQRADLPGTESGVRQRLVAPFRRLAAAREAFAKQDAMMRFFCETFGPYPFDDYTVVVTDDSLEIPVEAQGMSVFGSNHAGLDWDDERLVAHELAHQWFGNSLTLGDWRDIWLHEGFAAYAEWLWSQASGGKSADEHARYWHRQLAKLPQDLILADPGPADLFDDRVYKRGALTLHALRLTVGDTLFFRILHGWATGYRHATVSTPEFIALVGTYARWDLGTLFADWLSSPALPELPEPGSAASSGVSP